MTAANVFLRRSTIMGVMMAVCLQGYAQETVNKELDDCIKREQMTSAAKGAAVGALAGLAKSFFGKEKDKKDALANVLVGAVAGGAIGYATSYFTAAEKCLKKNPAWIPESKIVRSKTYDDARKEIEYDPKQGAVSVMRSLDMPATIKPGNSVEISSRFIVMTPNGEEAKVKIERKLFAISEGKETEVPFLGRGVEERTLEAGEHADTAKLPIPKDTDGIVYRIQYRVSVADKDASEMSASVTVG